MEHTHLVKGLDFALLQKVSHGGWVKNNPRMLNPLVWAFQSERGEAALSPVHIGRVIVALD